MLIRLATEADAAGVQAVYGPVVVDSPASFEWTPPSVEEMAARIAATLPDHPWLVAVHEDSTVAGYAYAGPHAARAAYRWSTDVSVYVASQSLRRGIGSNLYRALFALLGVQGYRQAFAGITLPNPASVGLHQSLGFTPVGVYRRVGWKFGAWHDVGWWQLSLGDDGRRPAPPRAVDQCSPAEVEAALAQAGLA